MYGILSKEMGRVTWRGTLILAGVEGVGGWRIVERRGSTEPRSSRGEEVGGEERKGGSKEEGEVLGGLV